MNRFSTQVIRSAALLALACCVSANALPAGSTLRPQASGTSAASSQSATSSAKKKSRKHHTSRRQSFQKAPTPERISEIQSALARGGYYQGQPNGKWDSNTISALQKFQSDNGMNASGKLDAPSLQKLGLGSSTAGVDAPKPLSHTSPTPNTTSASVPAADPATATASNVAATHGPTPASSQSATAKPPQR